MGQRDSRFQARGDTQEAARPYPPVALRKLRRSQHIQRFSEPGEIRWKNPNNRVGLVIEPDGVADGIAAGPESFDPQSMTQDGNVRSARSCLVLSERTAQQWRDAGHRQKSIVD
jgi:hypothetical protein